jgi:hypothetical protein
MTGFKHKGKEYLAENIEANIWYIYALSNEDERVAGKVWYQEAHNEAMAMHAEYPQYSLAQIVACISALSPVTRWEKNIEDTWQLLSLGKKAIVTTYGGQKEKALSILADDKDIVGKLGTAAFKTRSFYFNILNPDVNGPVTLDRHAICVSLGLWDAGSHTLSERKYRLIEVAYQSVAGKVGIKSHELQAILWLTYKRLVSR